jgi:hypothetical protein
MKLKLLKYVRNPSEMPFLMLVIVTVVDSIVVFSPDLEKPVNNIAYETSEKDNQNPHQTRVGIETGIFKDVNQIVDE